MLDIKNTVAEAASQVSQRISQVASDAIGAVTDSITRAGSHMVDGVIAKASKLVGMPEQDTSEKSDAQAPEQVSAAGARGGKAAAKKRKAARLAMQRLVKAAKRTASAAGKN